MSDSLFVRVASREVTDVKPVWMMRQAGRYLPEYQELRAHFKDFLSFVSNPMAAAEATLQPVRRFSLDAAILFSDILVTLPYMGFDLDFAIGKGPVIKNPMRSYSDVKLLSRVNFEKDLLYTKEALKKVKESLPSDTALLGFVGGPLTIASYAIEGGTSKDLSLTKALYYKDPSTYEAFLLKVADITGEYLAKQAEWGATALVVMDSWAGNLSKEDYAFMARPYTQKVLSIVRQKTDAPVIYYANGAQHLIDDFTLLGFDVIGLDHRSDLASVFEKHPETVFQGNLDPAILFASPEVVKERARIILDKVKNRAHIMNLGHGVLPLTPVANVQAFVDAVRGL
ncbi:MAG: uroporphyrinogen decarboxylase [Fibrobacteraceae bacterium]|nr:uroporphyrinogen decarboxylase [Fibrobacteraceae bacterium]